MEGLALARTNLDHMRQHEASRTLVKSPPELWAECSDAASLARHLDGFGEIRITRLEPETAVAWEGERASGTVRLEPSGWGTRVVLTAAPVGQEPVPEPPVIQPALPEPEPVVELGRPQRESLLMRLRRWLRGPGLPESELIVLEPVDHDVVVARPPMPPEPPPSPDSQLDADATAALTAALDSLGQAHHRPFSRA